MLRMVSIGLVALGIVVSMTADSQAQVYVRVPFVRVYSGPPVYPVGPSFSMRIPLRSCKEITYLVVLDARGLMI